MLSCTCVHVVKGKYILGLRVIWLVMLVQGSYLSKGQNFSKQTLQRPHKKIGLLGLFLINIFTSLQSYFFISHYWFKQTCKTKTKKINNDQIRH